MKISVLILYTELWQPIADIVLPNAEVYCKKQGYRFYPIFYKEYTLDFGYNKLERIKELFSISNNDVVFSLDCDTLITNHNITVEDFIDEEHDFYVTKDVNGINFGSFIIKKSEWSDNFLNKTIAARKWPNMHCEQEAVAYYMANFNIDKIKILGHPSINSYDYSQYPEFPNIRKREQGHHHEVDFILHLPALSIEKRIEILRNTKVIE